MIGVDESTRADEVLLEALDFEVPCQVQTLELWSLGRLMLPAGMLTKPCGNPAAWAIRCRACAGAMDSCEEHRRDLLAQDRAMCGRCRRVAPGWLLFDTTPLPGGGS